MQAYPGPGRKWPVSTGGGAVLVWARDGAELFYRNGDAMMAVAVTTSPVFSVAEPQLLFRKHRRIPVRRRWEPTTLAATVGF